MSKEMIKEKLHEVIDQLEDKGVLEQLYVQALENKYHLADEEDSITEEEWEQINEGLAQIRNGEPCTHEAVMKKFFTWQQTK